MTIRLRLFQLVFVLLTGALFSPGMPVNAQNTDTLVLDIEATRRHAVEYNRSIENAKLDIDAADKRIRENIATGLPQIDASIDYSNFMGADIIFRFDESMPAQTIPFKPTSNMVFSLNQLIFSGSYIVGLQAAKIYKNLTENNYEKSEIDIKQQVTSTYYMILVSERSLDIVRQNLENVRKTYQNTVAMAKVGMAERTDVDQLEVSVTMLENAVRSAERQVEINYNLLRLQLGVDKETAIELSEDLNTILAGIDFNAALNQSFYLENNIEYRLMKTQEELNEKQVDLEKMNYLPVITGFYTHQEKILKPNFDMQPKNMIGLQANIPIFSSFMRKARVDQALITLEKTRNSKELVRQQLEVQESQYRYNLKNAMEQYAGQQKNVEVAQRVINSFTLKYQQGIVTSQDLIVANDNYLQAESNYISALMQLLIANLDLQKLLNNI